MRKIYAFQTTDGRTFPAFDDAKRHAQKQYDNLMTQMRLDMQGDKIGLQAAFAAMTWIEQNFDLIAEASGLKCDADIVENFTDEQDD